MKDITPKQVTFSWEEYMQIVSRIDDLETEIENKEQEIDKLKEYVDNLISNP